MEVGEERALALVAVGVRRFDEGLVVGDDDPALAAGDDLRRVEGERARDPERARTAPAERAAVGVRRVLDQVHAPRRAQPFERGHGRADEAADVDGDDRRGVGRDPGLDVGEIESHGRGVAVGEHDACAGVHRRGGGGEERVRGDDDLAALDVERARG